LTATPDIYIVGCQKRFGTRLVEHGETARGVQRCRLVMVPEFSKTGALVLVNIRTLDVKTVCFGTEGTNENADDAELYAQALSPSEVPPESVAASSPEGTRDMDSP